MRHAAWPRILARRPSRRVHERQWLTRRSSPVWATQITFRASFLEWPKCKWITVGLVAVCVQGRACSAVARLWCRQMPCGTLFKESDLQQRFHTIVDNRDVDAHATLST